MGVKIRGLIFGLVFLLLLLSSVDVYAQSISNSSNATFVPGDVIIKLLTDVNISGLRFGITSVDRIGSSYGMYNVSRVFSYVDSRGKEAGLNRVYLLRFPNSTNLSNVVNDYNNDVNIEYAEFNFITAIDFIPNDPLYNQQWSLQKANLEDAWSIERGKKEVIIAILDTGVQLNHPDLDDNIWVNDDPIDGLDNDGNGFVDDIRGWDFVDEENNASDENGHGTHVAGIAAAEGDNSIGVAGVCMNCSIMPVRALGGENTSLDVAEGMNYAIINNASIISMSLNIGGCNVVSSLLDDMANLAYSNGIVISKSAGNDNEGCRKVFTTYNLIMVAASDEGDEKAIFSNYGGWNPYFFWFTGTVMKAGAVVDVTAPGVNILSTIIQSGYGSKGGTSMSTPFVSGLAGLLLSENPSLTVEQVKALIKSTVDKPALSNNFYIGVGRVNASRALMNANKNPAVARINHTETDGGLFSGQIKINGTANGQTFSMYNVEVADATWPNNVYNLSFVDIASSTIPVSYGTLATFIPTTSGKYVIRLRVINTVGFESIDQIFVTVSLSNQCGDIASSTALNNRVVSLDSNFSSTCFNIVQDDVVFDCKNNSISGVGFGTAIAAIGRDNVTIKNCFIEGFQTSIFLTDTNSSIIKGIKTMSDTNPGDINLQNSFNNKIISNDIFTGGPGFSFGIAAGGGGKNIIANNTVSATRLGVSGISFSGKNNIIKSNVVSIAGASETSFMPAFAIWVGSTGSANNSITGNNVTANRFAVGVSLYYGSSNNNVSYNRFKMLGRNGMGIVIDTVDSGNTIMNNLILNKGQEGVGIIINEAIAEQTIMGNNMTVNNSIGLVLLAGSFGEILQQYRHIIPDSNFVNNKLIKYVRAKNNLVFDGSNIGEFICIDCRKITFSNANMTGGNLLLVNTTNSTFKNIFIKTSRFTAQLILSDRNRFISNSFLTSSGFESIVLVGSSNNTFIASNVTVKKLLGEFADEYASFGLYDFTGNTTNSANNLAKDMLLKNENITVSFKDRLGTSLASVNEIFLPPNPPGKVDIGKFIRLASNDAGSWIALNISYKDSELTGVAENTLKIWMFDPVSEQWVDTGFYTGQNNVNAANNVVFANITFSGLLFSQAIFGVFGDFSIATTTSTTSSTSSSTSSTISTTTSTSTSSISTTTTSTTTTIPGTTSTTSSTTSTSTTSSTSTIPGTTSTTSSTTSSTTASTTTTIILTCGQNVSSSVVMTNSLACFIDNSKNALRINANNINLDCNGYNILGNGSGIGISIGNRTGVTIKNCNVINFLSGATVSTGNANLFLNNRLINNGNLGQGFGLGTGSKNNIVYNNTFTGNYLGLALFGPGTGSSAFYNNISRNKFSSNRYAIRIESHNNTFVNNLINNSIVYGIEFFGSAKFNNITKNTILNSTSAGIKLGINTNRNTISRNSISKNDIGIFLFNSLSNMIYSNNISDNNKGIGIASASGNLIYNNYFKNVAGNAKDDWFNYWNTTKTSGVNIVGGPFIAGNFWHDYTGQDNNGDFIGDTNLPYNSGGNIVNGGDYLPLTQFTIATTTSSTSTTTSSTTVTITTTSTTSTIPANLIASCSNDPNQPGVWKVTQDLSSSGATCLDILVNDVVLDCQGHKLSGSGSFGSSGMDVIGFDNITIKNCIVDNYFSGIFIHDGSNVNSIINNTLSNNVNGLIMISSNGNSIINNTAIDNGNGISFSGDNNIIIGNNASSNANDGIQAVGNGNTLIDNVVDANAYFGIRVENAINGAVEDNVITNNYVGIKLISSTGITINGNTLANNIVDIYIDPSNNNQIINNLITSATSGIQIDNSTGNLVRRNNITENTFGIILKGSNSNLIYDNYFMRNNFNAQDRDGVNYWNTTRQIGNNILGGNIIGGNFWFDYKGNDTNKDGIGDTRLPYDSGNRIKNGGDYLPLYKTFVTGGPSPGPGQHRR